MDIKNLGEFADYCNQHSEDEDYRQGIELAGQVADVSETINLNYGRTSADMGVAIGDAWRRLTPEAGVTEPVLRATEDTLTRFWKHGDQFKKWLETRVLVLRAEKP